MAERRRMRGSGCRMDRAAAAGVLLCAALVVAALLAALVWFPSLRGEVRASDGGGSSPSGAAGDVERGAVPSPARTTAARARELVAAMDLGERVGQLVMAPLFAGDNPSVLEDAVRVQHVGSVLLLGNWRSGVEGVRGAVDALQSYARDGGDALIVAADQEGGQVQHLGGDGFDVMPSAVEQGRMSTDRLRAAAAGWGAQLAGAGVNVDLAPVLGTVVIDRAANEPIGALDRDFGLDAAGNAAHGKAFVLGMRDAGVRTAVKHYPGLGAVRGNTDFTSEGILDETTSKEGAEAAAFHTVIAETQPDMVMMSLATYRLMDLDDPAAFSSAIVEGTLRGEQGYDGVVISDSLSAAAVGDVPADQLGVRLVEAGGDLACIGQSAYVSPVLEGLNRRAAEDRAFAAKVGAAAERVVRLKLDMGLLR